MIEYEMYNTLEEMNMPIIDCPDDILALMNAPRKKLASIQDPREVNEYMIGVSQFLMYARQQYNIYGATYAKLKREFEHTLNILAAQDGSRRSLTEKRSIAIENNPELQSMQEEMDRISLKKNLIEDWIDDCKEFLNALKRVHDDLIIEKTNYLKNQ